MRCIETLNEINDLEEELEINRNMRCIETKKINIKII